MDKRNDKDRNGHPSDYGSRTLADEERERAQSAEIGRTADGEPNVDRGTADSAISSDEMQDDSSA